MLATRSRNEDLAEGLAPAPVPRSPKSPAPRKRRRQEHVTPINQTKRNRPEPSAKSVRKLVFDDAPCVRCLHCSECSNLSKACDSCVKAGTGIGLSWKDVQYCQRCGVCVHKTCLPVAARISKREQWACAGCAPDVKKAEARWLRHLEQLENEPPLDWTEKASPISPAVKMLYQEMKKNDGLSGTGVGGSGMYGEVTMVSFQRILDLLRAHTGLTSDSVFLDVGSGAGKPSLHAAFDRDGVKSSFGIELGRHPWALSVSNTANVLTNSALMAQCPRKPVMGFVCGNAAELTSLEPFTHIYGFDKGWHPSDRLKLSMQFNRSTTATTLVSYDGPSAVILDHGFAVRYLGKCTVRMIGSGQGHTAHVYVKDRSEEHKGREETPAARESLEELAKGADPRFARLFLDHLHPEAYLASLRQGVSSGEELLPRLRRRKDSTLSAE